MFQVETGGREERPQVVNESQPALLRSPFLRPLGCGVPVGEDPPPGVTEVESVGGVHLSQLFGCLRINK